MSVSSITTMTSKGQVQITREVRNELKLKSGQKMVEIVEGNSVRLIPIPENPLMALKGIWKGSGITAAEIEKDLDDKD